MPKIAREIHLVKRPLGLPGPDSFQLAERRLAELAPGQLLVRNQWISVDPYMRGRMTEKKSFIPPFALNEVMEGAAVGSVEESRDPAFTPGDTVSHFAGWRDLALIDAAGAAVVDPAFPLQAYLGPLGFPGLAAYAGFLRLGEPKPGETVFVSAAAGAVGSLVAQIARIKGNRVIASAGSPDKIDWLLKEAGVDAVINYKTEKDITAALAKAAPKGIDIYFDNVGGDHLEAAIANANDFARFALCGMIAQYNSEPVGPPQHLCRHRKEPEAPGLHRLQPSRSLARLSARHETMDRARPDQMERDGRRRSRKFSQGIPRHLRRRQCRQDAGQAHVSPRSNTS